MTYNIIGDIHGRANWKDIIKEDAINIFIGDYFSPYPDENISYVECKANFLDIIQYKKEHMDTTILLVGNHDAEYWHFTEQYSRHDYEHKFEIRQLFEDNKDLFVISYAIEDKAIVTHAGVSYVWYEYYKNNNIIYEAYNCNYDDPDEVEDRYSHEKHKFENPIKYTKLASADEAWKAVTKSVYKYDNKERQPKKGEFIKWQNKLWRYNEELNKFELFNIKPTEVADFINDLYLNKKNYNAFNFRNNGSWHDYYGDSISHGPLWIRTTSLKNVDIFNNDYWQFLGHTQVLYNIEPNMDPDKILNIVIDNKMVCCDFLGYGSYSILYDSETDEIKLNKK